MYKSTKIQTFVFSQYFLHHFFPQMQWNKVKSGPLRYLSLGVKVWELSSRLDCETQNNALHTWSVCVE